jgi:hypothetical protein
MKIVFDIKTSKGKDWAKRTVLKEDCNTSPLTLTDWGQKPVTQTPPGDPAVTGATGRSQAPGSHGNKI